MAAMAATGLGRAGSSAPPTTSGMRPIVPGLPRAMRVPCHSVERQPAAVRRRYRERMAWDARPRHFRVWARSRATPTLRAQRSVTARIAQETRLATQHWGLHGDADAGAGKH